MKKALKTLILLMLIILVGGLFGFPSAFANTQGRVSLMDQGFVSPDYKLTERKNFQFVGAGIDTLGRFQKEEEIDNSLQAQVRGVVAPGTSVLNYLNVSQLFWKQNGLTVGRKKISWSLLDDEFQLGLYQPLFKWNALQTESQGLTGVFLNLLNEEEGTMPWGLTVFGSPLFVPDQGPGYEIKDGQFEKSSPYFQATPTRADINGQVVDVSYNVQKPKTEDIIYNTSFAGRVFLGSERKGFFSQLAFASKPSNQLALAFDGYLVSDGNIDVTKVDILPSFYFHQVTSADIKWMGRNFGAGLSGLHESPGIPKFEDQWTYVVYKESSLVSPFLQFRGNGFDAKVAYLSVAGGDASPVGKFANQSSKFLPQRYPFKNAGLASVGYRYRLKKDAGVGVSTRYLQGERSEFALWTSQLYYQWEERWAMNLQSQVVAVQDNADGRSTGYWPFVNNDSVSVGVQYVF